jgi:hypothetical protein
MYFLFAFHWWLNLVNIISFIYWPFVLLYLKRVCLAHLPTYWLDYLLFWCSIFLSSLYILDINHLSYKQLANIFSHSISYLITLLIISFAVQKIFCLMQSHSLVLTIISEECSFFCTDINQHNTKYWKDYSFPYWITMAAM